MEDSSRHDYIGLLIFFFVFENYELGVLIFMPQKAGKVCLHRR